MFLEKNSHSAGPFEAAPFENFKPLRQTVHCAAKMRPKLWKSHIHSASENQLSEGIWSFFWRKKNPAIHIIQPYLYLILILKLRIFEYFFKQCAQFLSWFNELREEVGGICFCAFWLHNSHDGRPLRFLIFLFYQTIIKPAQDATVQNIYVTQHISGCLQNLLWPHNKYKKQGTTTTYDKFMIFC